MSNFRSGGFQQLPTIVRNLLIINVLVFLIQQLFEARGIAIGQGLSFDDVFALHSWQSSKFRWWQMLTHMFMHGSIPHILFNMFALWMFGRILENVWGPQRFLIFYLICGLGAAVCHLGVLSFENIRFYNAFMAYQEHPSFVEYAQFVKHHDILRIPDIQKLLDFWSSTPGCSNCVQESTRLINECYTVFTNEATVGASGAIFGLLFAFGYLFPNTEMYIYFIPIPVKAKWVIAGYILIELTQGLANSAGDNVAHFAHLGGALVAFILLRIWKSRVKNNFY